MRKSKELETTTNSRVYNLLKKGKIASEKNLCFYCPPNRGCNQGNCKKTIRNWKEHRKTQWKE